MPLYGAQNFRFDPTTEAAYVTMPIGASGTSIFSFNDEITLQPGETVTLAATTVTGTATYTLMTLNTREDQ